MALMALGSSFEAEAWRALEAKVSERWYLSPASSPQLGIADTCQRACTRRQPAWSYWGGGKGEPWEGRSGESKESLLVKP